MAENYTKSDFLSPFQVAKKLNLDTVIVQKKMLEQYRKGTKILVSEKRHSQPMIYNMTSCHAKASRNPSSPLRLHPLAFEMFKDILTHGERK